MLSGINALYGPWAALTQASITQIKIAAINKGKKAGMLEPNKLPKNSLFGNKINPRAPNSAPKNKYGILLPKRVKVLLTIISFLLVLIK